MSSVDFVTRSGNSFIPTGPVASRLSETNWDPGYYRPYTNSKGKRCVSLNTGELVQNEEGLMEPVYEEVPISHLVLKGMSLPIWNAASLPKQAWELYDTRVVEIMRKRLRAWSDLAGWGSLSFNGLPYLMLEHETINDPGEAQVDFDATSEANTDMHQYVLEGVPLPITHSNFHYSHRHEAVASNRGTPLGSMSMSRAARRVAEKVEQTTIGTISGITGWNASNYGRTPQVYGYTNFPARITNTDITQPNGSNGPTIFGEILELIQSLAAVNVYGPFMLYHSPSYQQYLDDDYRDNDDRTLRNRIRQVDEIADVKQLDYLGTTANPYQLVIVQMDESNARAVTGMGVTTVMWQTHGGLKTHIKVMTIMVPQLFADQNGQCGILHATVTS